MDSILETTAGYLAVKTKAQQLINEADNAIVYLETEVTQRLSKMALLIQEIEKNPEPQKVNSLKKALIVRNFKKQTNLYQ